MIKGVRYVSVMPCVMGITTEAVAIPENISSLAPLTIPSWNIGHKGDQGRLKRVNKG